MITLLHRTSALALTAALTFFAAQAGHCGTGKAPPIPPHQPTDFHFIFMLAHLLHF